MLVQLLVVRMEIRASRPWLCLLYTSLKERIEKDKEYAAAYFEGLPDYWKK